MQRYFIYLSYNGRNYCGWQSQPNGVSIQSVVEKALSLILREKAHLDAAGRTDAGVHAMDMVAHFDATEIPINLVENLNSILPPDIAVNKIARVKNEAHARFDALARTYHYYITYKKDPFYGNYAYKIHRKLDVEAVNKAAATLFDFTDFTSFSKLHTDTKTNNCRILQAEFVPHGDGLYFVVRADRFLRNMVRAIVGTLLEVGRGKMNIDEFRAIIEAKDRCRAGTSVPAQGLFLIKVEYRNDIFF